MNLALVSYSFVIITTTLIFTQIDLDGGTMTHVLFSISGYSLLFVSFILSFVVNLQRKQLKLKALNNKIINTLPPLEKVENLLFSNIYLSFLLITFAIISGFVFLDDIFAQQLVHKTFFTILAWILLLMITALRLQFGLRDKKATRLIQASFIFIVIGYFGSKLVLSLIN